MSFYIRMQYFVYSEFIFWFGPYGKKIIKIVFRKKKLRIVQYLIYSNFVSFNSWDQDQIGNKASYN